MNSNNDSCSENSDFDYESDMMCPSFNDTVLCWPATLANTTAYQYCTGRMHSQAHRQCLSNGKWDEMANYSSCIDDFHWSNNFSNETTGVSDDARFTAKVLVLIMFVGGIISLVVLTISLIIFHRFKSLHCDRTRIHKHLIASFILRSLIIVITLEPHISGRSPWHKSAELVCRFLLTLQNLSFIANFNWMLVEGLYLHIILVMRPLSSEKVPFIIFYIIGWVIPLLIAVVWALVMHFEHEEPCWARSTGRPYIFIIYTPIMLALFINLLILMNLVRIIVYKLCTGHTAEQRRIWTVKSTLVLVFLLGIINLLFVTNGNAGKEVTRAYRYFNAVLPNCQGIVVAAICCGFNAEVRRAIRKRWNRFVDSRSLYSSAYRGRTTRTSVSTFLSRPHQCHDSERHVVELQSLKETAANGDSTRRDSNMWKYGE